MLSLCCLAQRKRIHRARARWFRIGAAPPRLLVWISFAKFRRLPSYHTWLAKTLAVYMALALLLLLNGYWPWLFRAGAAVVLVEAMEEIAITRTLDRWRADIPSWWHLRRERGARR